MLQTKEFKYMSNLNKFLKENDVKYVDMKSYRGMFFEPRNGNYYPESRYVLIYEIKEE